MPDYSKGMIHMLEPTIDYEEGDIYYGSTTQPLHKRLFQHKSDYTNTCVRPCNSKLIFQKYGMENVKIILIKYYSCESKKELEAEEATYIRNNKCVNRVIPNRSIKEYRETNKDRIKDYYEENKEKILEKMKDYYETNKEKKKEYRETNKEKKKEYLKEYYERNKEKLNEELECECGCKVVKQSLKRHQTSKKHINLMKNIIV
jgi:hypothetical protein